MGAFQIPRLISQLAINNDQVWLRQPWGIRQSIIRLGSHEQCIKLHFSCVHENTNSHWYIIKNHEINLYTHNITVVTIQWYQWHDCNEDNVCTYIINLYTNLAFRGESIVKSIISNCSPKVCMAYMHSYCIAIDVVNNVNCTRTYTQTVVHTTYHKLSSLVNLYNDHHLLTPLFSCHLNTNTLIITVEIYHYTI